jgi:uncharacterized membrane protein
VAVFPINSWVASEKLIFQIFFFVKPEIADVINGKSCFSALTSGVVVEIRCYQVFLVTNCALVQDYPLLTRDAI